MYEIINLALAIAAIMIAGVSLIATIRLQRRQLEFQAINAALAKKQLEVINAQEESESGAEVTAELVNIGGSGYRFVLFNQGSVAAADVNLELIEATSDDPLLPNECARKLPYPLLDPGQSFTLVAALSLGSAMVYMARVTWKDPDGSRHSRECCLSL
jgi:hypothetical protein